MYVITTQGKANKTLFLVDRNIIKNRWWSTDVDNAFVFRSESAAIAQKNKLVYKSPEVITYREAKMISKDQFMDSIHDEIHPHDLDY